MFQPCHAFQLWATTHQVKLHVNVKMAEARMAPKVVRALVPIQTGLDTAYPLPAYFGLPPSHHHSVTI